MNYKYLILLFPLLFSTKPAGAQEKYAWYFAVNTTGCSHCLNGLSYLDHLDPRYPKTIIFSRADRRDSAALIKKLFLEQFRGNIVFNDSLYHKFLNRSSLQSSGVSLLNRQNGQYITLPLTYLVYNNFDLNHLLQAEDTIRLRDSVFNLGKTSTLFSSKAIAVLNRNTSQISLIKRGEDHSYRTITFTDSLLKKAYISKFGTKAGAGKFSETFDYIRKNRTIGFAPQVCGWDLSGDTLRTSLYLPLLLTGQHGRPDTLLKTIQMMYTFVAGDINDITYIDNYLINTPDGYEGIRRHYFNDQDSLKRSKDAYLLGMEFFFYKASLYNAIFGLFLAGDAPNQSLAKYREDPPGNWVFDRYAGTLPDNYVKEHTGYNLLFKGSSICHSGSYYCYFYGHQLRSVDADYPDISLEPVFKDIRQQGVTGRLALVDFKILKDTVYLLIDNYNKGKGALYSYRYNPHTARILSKKIINRQAFPESYDFPTIDPFDYDYIMTPVADNEIFRLKIW